MHRCPSASHWVGVITQKALLCIRVLYFDIRHAKTNLLDMFTASEAMGVVHYYGNPALLRAETESDLLSVYRR